MTVLVALLVIALALVHLFAGRLRLVGNLSRVTWLSAAGGVAVAYVFLHLMPDLAAHRQQLGLETRLGPEGAERLVFLFALAGLMAGGALAGLARLPELALSLVFAFLAGGIVLNVLKEELPEERQARLMPFIPGAALYSLVLAFI